MRLDKSKAVSLQRELQNLIKNCQKKGILLNQIKTVKLIENYHQNLLLKFEIYFKWFSILVFFVYEMLLFYDNFNSAESFFCLWKTPKILQNAFRQPQQCDFCTNIVEIEHKHNISNDLFTKYYAYTARPLVIENATYNWSAMEIFDYWYFQDIFRAAKHKEKIINCQFLPYTTGFRNIYEALSMPDDRVAFLNSSEPWYFGWSNCNTETAELIRKHYQRLDFLPKNSENRGIDWFFMGTNGLGAQMHVDAVRWPSWQVQLSGSKKWQLAPPSECYFSCKFLSVVVKKGETNTNKWYHQTIVEPGEISLTVGAEFD